MGIFGVLLLDYATVEKLKGIIDIAVYAFIFEKICELIKPNAIGIL